MFSLILYFFFFFFKQKTAYEMRISDWSSDVCSSDLATRTLSRGSSAGCPNGTGGCEASTLFDRGTQDDDRRWNPILTAAPSFSGKTPDFEFGNVGSNPTGASIPSQRLRSYRHELPRKGHLRSEEHTSELQSLMRISYAVFCL